jgi:glutamate-1-semialdehyde 2,1-aminomutase
MTVTHSTVGTDSALAIARQRFGDRNPQSRILHEQATRSLPGGNTRTLFYQPPFPLTFVRGEGSVLHDADGHSYIDLVGDYTAGLLGHGNEQVRDAVFAALSTNSSVGGIHPVEQQLGELMCARWNLDKVRFTNSGTEANLMAITAARAATKRSAIVVMEAGYHGGVLYFGLEPASWTVPFPFHMARFNDIDHCRSVIEAVGDDLAAVIVEPMMGSAGCIPAEPGFLGDLADAVHAVGGVLIVDEVMTSRHGRAGLVGEFAIPADIVTFGKYIAGGFSFGAFGGTEAVMELFDARRPGAVAHSGTFNNNVASLSAGVAVLSSIYTADHAEVFTARGHDVLATIRSVVEHHDAGLSVSGFGSMMNIHASATPPGDGRAALQRDWALQELLYLEMLDRGVYMAPRGMINLSLVVTDDQLGSAIAALDDVCGDLASKHQVVG